MIPEFKNLSSLRAHFKTELKCYQYIEKLRWNGKPTCAHCGSEKVYKFADKIRYRCGEKGCLKMFNAKAGTFMEGSKIPLLKWFEALYLASSHKKGISSIQLGKDIGVTQTTAWFMLGRIRQGFADRNPMMLSGEIEIDHSQFGGIEGNKKQSAKAKELRMKKAEMLTGEPYRARANRTTVLGIMQRGGEVRSIVSKMPVTYLINQNVEKGSTIYSDAASNFKQLSRIGYKHSSVDHSQKEFKRGSVHTASLDSYWSVMKRGIIGIYHQVSEKHLHRYCAEFSFRFSTRKMNEVDRFNLALERMGGSRLRYSEYIKKGKEQTEYPSCPIEGKDWGTNFLPSLD